MSEAHDFLRNLALVLCAAAVTTVIFERLRQPVVLGYLLAGMLIGPHVPVPLVANIDIVHQLSELGVILLMFSLGLEFSVERLFRVFPMAGMAAVLETSFMIWLGYVTAQFFGWTVRESIYAGAMVAISSTTIIVKVFAEQRVAGNLVQLVFGLLIVEDLIAILLLALLTSISAGDDISPASVVITAMRLGAFLAALLVAGLLLVPRLMRSLVRLARPETILIASIGICFAVALLASAFGYSVALGAFLAGSLIAESGVQKEIQTQVAPVRDLFAAVFFVSVGMLISPAAIAANWAAVIAFMLIVVVGKVVGVSVGTFLVGQGIRTSVQASMSMAQIGEFSFIIAGLGVALHATGDFLYAVAVSVSGVTTLLAPWLIRGADRASSYIDRRLPKPLQTFAALYGSWLERLRAAPPTDTARARARRLVRWLLVDAGFLVAIVVGASVEGERVVDSITALGLSTSAARVALGIATAGLCAPFAAGMMRCARELGIVLGGVALPGVDSTHIDLADAPRKALIVTLQLNVLLLVGAPLVALTQPFLPPFYGAVILFAALFIFGVAFWRSATNLQGHARAGAQLIVEALLTRARGPRDLVDERALEALQSVLPGLGTPAPIRLRATSHAVGKTLAELNLRGLTAATVLAIVRDDGAVVVPTGKEVLQNNDVLAVAGSREAIAAARRLLIEGDAADRDSPDTRARLAP